MPVDRWSYELGVNLMQLGPRISRLGSAKSVVDFLRPNVTTVKIVTDHSQAVLCFLVISMDLVQIVITDPHHLGAPSEKVFQYVTDM
jgi:hypothetical protein